MKFDSIVITKFKIDKLHTSISFQLFKSTSLLSLFFCPENALVLFENEK